MSGVTQSGKNVSLYEELFFLLYRMRQSEHSPFAPEIGRGNVENGHRTVSVSLPRLQLPVLDKRMAVCKATLREMPALLGIGIDHLAAKARQAAAANPGPVGSAPVPLCRLPEEFRELSAPPR